MRTLLFVLIGVTVGVAIARTSGDEARRPDHRRSAPAVGSDSNARAPWMVPVRRASVRQRDLQAADDRYDAFLLAHENPELSPKEIFDGEPRDPAFAPTLEKRIRTGLATAFRDLELEDKIRAVETECKTLSCYTRIEVSREDGWSVYNAINGVMLGDLQEPGIDESDPERTYVMVGNLYRASIRDDAEYEKFLSEGMRPSLDAAKQRMLEAHHAAQQDAPR